MGIPSFYELVIVFSILLILFLYVLMFWKIVKKAGFSGWWALVTFIPFLNIVMFWVFAFIKWPIEKGRENKSN